MRLLLKAEPNADTSWGRYVVVLLDKRTIGLICQRVAIFNALAAGDVSLTEMVYQECANFYESDLAFRVPRAASARFVWHRVVKGGGAVSAEEILSDDEYAIVLDGYKVQGTKSCIVGYSCMIIGSSGVQWEAGEKAGSIETQTFPIKLDDLLKLIKEQP